MVGSVLIVHKNNDLLSILQYEAIVAFRLLEYFRISMWSVKTSVWSVSGLRENVMHIGDLSYLVIVPMQRKGFYRSPIVLHFLFSLCD